MGIRSTALSQMMQMDAKLTLESAKMQVRQSEAVKEQQLPPQPSQTGNGHGDD